MKPENMTMGERIRSMRTERGMSQQDLADLLGLSRIAILKWENGESRPIRRLDDLAKVFHVTTDFILTGRYREKDLPDLPPMFQVSHEERKLIEEYRGLGQSQKIALSTILTDMRKAKQLDNEQNNDDEDYIPPKMA